MRSHSSCLVDVCQRATVTLTRVWSEKCSFPQLAGGQRVCLLSYLWCLSQELLLRKSNDAVKSKVDMRPRIRVMHDFIWLWLLFGLQVINAEKGKHGYNCFSCCFFLLKSCKNKRKVQALSIKVRIGWLNFLYPCYQRLQIPGGTAKARYCLNWHNQLTYAHFKSC